MFVMLRIITSTRQLANHHDLMYVIIIIIIVHHRFIMYSIDTTSCFMITYITWQYVHLKGRTIIIYLIRIATYCILYVLYLMIRIATSCIFL